MNYRFDGGQDLPRQGRTIPPDSTDRLEQRQAEPDWNTTDTQSDQ